MYTIEEISKRMREQNNLASQGPLWVVLEDVKDYVGDWGNEVERKDDIDSDLLCEKCKELYDEGTMPDYCEDCDSECFVHYNIEEKPNLTPGVFFTQAACQDHIDKNHYHYSHPRPYAYTSWRNPEMKAVMKLILLISGNTLPNHYRDTD